jgi:hypothetical protein
MNYRDLTTPSQPSRPGADFQATARRIGLFTPVTAETNLNSMPHIVDVDCPAGSGLKRPNRFKDRFFGAGPLVPTLRRRRLGCGADCPE